MNMQSPVVPHFNDERGDLVSEYLGIVGLTERLHRQLLEVIRREFERAGVHDINPTQGLLLFNIGPQTVTAGDLTSRGYYQGSNVSYNLKKLTELGYVECERSTTDRRSVRVRLTGKAMDVHSVIASLFQRHARDLGTSDHLKPGGVQELKQNMQSIERYWIEQLRAVS